MNDKYEITSVSIDFFGKKLFQIKAKRSFWSVNKWDLGGYIEKEKNLSASDNSWVFGNARVYDNARVSENAWVYGDARVYDNAIVSGNASIYDGAWVYGDARVYDNATVSGNAWVSGDATVSGNALVSGDAIVSGNARLLAKNNYTKWRFIGGDDSEKITIITDKTWCNYWKVQYVLGDYEITPQEEEEKEEKQSITLELTPEQIKKVRDFINNLYTDS